MAYKRERNLKVHYKTQSRQSRGWYAGSNYISVPNINLEGKWLEELGFEISTPIKVICEEGKLVIMRDTN